MAFLSMLFISMIAITTDRVCLMGALMISIFSLWLFIIIRLIIENWQDFFYRMHTIV